MPDPRPADPILPGPATGAARPASAGPYRVERVHTPDGPRWRLAGPGLTGTRTYPWEEFREKLGELADLMNFAWQQGRASHPDEK